MTDKQNKKTIEEAKVGSKLGSFLDSFIVDMLLFISVLISLVATLVVMYMVCKIKGFSANIALQNTKLVEAADLSTRYHGLITNNAIGNYLSCHVSSQKILLV